MRSTQKKTEEARQIARNRVGAEELGVCDGRRGRTRMQDGGDRHRRARETTGVMGRAG